MSNHKRFILLLPLMLLTLVLFACAEMPSPSTEEELLQLAVEDGIISQEATAARREDKSPELAPVEMGDIVATAELWIKIDMPMRQAMHFDRDDGRLKGIYVADYDTVAEGDILAEIEFDTVALEYERDVLLLTIEQFDQRFENENSRYTQEIERLRNEYNRSGEGSQRQTLGLLLEKQEMNYAWFLSKSEQERLDYGDILARIEEEMSGERLIAPFDGIVTGISAIEPGAAVRSSDIILTVINDSQFSFSAAQTAEALRFGDIISAVSRVTLDNNSVHEDTFLMRVVSDPLVNEMRFVINPLTMETRYDTVTYTLMPVDMDAFLDWVADRGISRQELAGIYLSGIIPVYEALDVMVVPNRAVIRENDRRYVYISEDGQLKKRYIVTGLSAQSYTQVLQGLQIGDMVAVG